VNKKQDFVAALKRLRHPKPQESIIMSDSSFRPFTDVSLDPFVRGFLHPPTKANGDGLVLTHGAGSNCKAPLLIALAEAFTGAGFTVLRCDLPYRQDRPFGPPMPGGAGRDREGLKRAVSTLRKLISGSVYLGGHSYGGRQSTMLCAEEPELVSGLLLFSYPLHPPRKPAQLRTQHFPKLQTPSLFVQGSRDPFGSMDEIESALKLIPARHELLAVEGAGHDLGFKGKARNQELPATVLAAFEKFFIPLSS
jgi:predicted alpha/beta-hydrolase family hydrolase